MTFHPTVVTLPNLLLRRRVFRTLPCPVTILAAAVARGVVLHWKSFLRAVLEPMVVFAAPVAEVLLNVLFDVVSLIVGPLAEIRLRRKQITRILRVRVSIGRIPFRRLYPLLIDACLW